MPECLYILLMSEPTATPNTGQTTAGSPLPDRSGMSLPEPPAQNWRRSFWALNITQFQKTFSTNAFQNLLSYMMLDIKLTHEQRDKMVPLILLFFSVPLMLFSMASGFLTDHFSKQQIIVETKLVEIGAMAAKIVALGTGYFPLQLAVLFV